MTELAPKEELPADDSPAYCERVSKRKAEYEAKMLTQKSLLELGKAISVREKNSMLRKEKHSFLISAIKELDQFDGNVFMTEFEKTQNVDLLRAKSYSLVRYISIFKELHNSNVNEIKALKAKVVELESDINDQRDQIESYIFQLDETDETISKANAKLTKQNASIKNLTNKLQRYYDKQKALIVARDSWKTSSKRYRRYIIIMSAVFIALMLYAYLN